MSGTCTQAELNQYSDCETTACSSAYSTCFGSGFKSGSFSGPCASYAQCTSSCGCNNQSCREACTPSADCEICITGSLLSCALTANCQLPACATGSSGVGGPSGGGTGGKAGGSGGSSGGLGGFPGTGGGTCADLLACCNAATGTNKSTSMSEYTAVMSMGDSQGSLFLTGFKALGYCP